jgi:hypothetical protein
MIPRRAGSTASVIGLAAVLLLCMTSAAVAELQPEPVRATEAWEWNPAASADYLAWAKITSTDPWRSDVWAKAYGDTPFRVNRKRVQANMGGIDGTTLVYQQYDGGSPYEQYGGTTSDIFFFDLATKDRSRAPDKVNTARWEYMPSLSGDWLLFARAYRNGDDKVLLYDIATDELRTLAVITGSRRHLWWGQVNGNYAVWEEWTGARDAVFLYDIAADTTARIPNPNDKRLGGPSVNPAGTVFYRRAGGTAADCGLNVRLMAYPIGGPAETLFSFRSGRDFDTSFALDNGDGTTDVFYDPFRCGKGRGLFVLDRDIYKVTYA